MGATVTTPGPAVESTASAAATATRPRTSLVRLGFWSAILTSVFSAGWLLTWMWQTVAAPMAWRGTEAAARVFQLLHILHLHPSILLAPTFLVLLACLYVYAPAEKKVWALSALAIGVVYATMASVNYDIQLVGVGMSLQSGESAGLEMFLQANPYSIFASLANAYVPMVLTMFFCAFIFAQDRHWAHRQVAVHPRWHAIPASARLERHL